MLDLNYWYELSPYQQNVALEIKSKCESICDWMLNEKCTIRQAAQELGISKSWIHRLIHTYIKRFYPEEYQQLIRLLRYNKKERVKPRRCWRGKPW